MTGDVLTQTLADGAVRRRAACSCTTAKRTRWAARTPWTTWSFGVLPTICWRPSRTLAEATWTASAARRRRPSLRGKDLATRAEEPDLTLQRSQRSGAGLSPRRGPSPQTSRATPAPARETVLLRPPRRVGAGSCDLASARPGAGSCDLETTRRARAGDGALASAGRASAGSGDLATARRAGAGGCDLETARPRGNL